MSNRKMQYEKPQLQYWTAAELDAIEATMSGGGGYASASCAVYLLNNVDGLSAVGSYGVLGHAAMMIQKEGSSDFLLYNFGPSDNKSAFHAGAVGGFSAGVMSFSTFRTKCKNGGVLVDNGVIDAWREGFDRYIRLLVSESLCYGMRSYANSKIKEPDYYSAPTFNCLSFVVDVLAYAGIVIYDSSGDNLSACIIPNTFFNSAASSSRGNFYEAQYL